MFRSINAPTGLVRTLTALSLVATIALVGCGTDVSTAPEFVSIESDDGGYQPGELPLPGHKSLLEAPKGLTIEDISTKGAIITWNAASTGLTTPSPPHLWFSVVDGRGRIRWTSRSMRTGT